MKNLAKMTAVVAITMASLGAQATKLDCIATAGDQQIKLKQEAINAQPAISTFTGIISHPKNANIKYSFFVETYASGQVTMQVDESRKGKIVSLMSSAGALDARSGTNTVLEGIMSKVYVHLSCLK